MFFGHFLSCLKNAFSNKFQTTLGLAGPGAYFQTDFKHGGGFTRLSNGSWSVRRPELACRRETCGQLAENFRVVSHVAENLRKTPHVDANLRKTPQVGET